MPLDVGCIQAVIFADLSVDKRKRDDLVVDREVKFILPTVEVKTMKEVVLDLLLDRYLLKGEVQHVGLEDYELAFRCLLYAEELVLHFYDVCKAMGLVGVFGWFVDEPELMRVITHQNGIKVGKHLKICYDLIDGKRSDL